MSGLLIHAREVSEIIRDKVTGESEVMQWRRVLCNTGYWGGVEMEKVGIQHLVALSREFVLLQIELR